VTVLPDSVGFWTLVPSVWLNARAWCL